MFILYRGKKTEGVGKKRETFGKLLFISEDQDWTQSVYTLRNEVRLICTCYFHAEGGRRRRKKKTRRSSVHQTQASAVSIPGAAFDIWLGFEMSFPCQSYLCGFASNFFLSPVPLSRELSVSVDMWLEKRIFFFFFDKNKVLIARNMTVVLDIKTHKLITCTDYDLQIYFMSVCNQSLTSCNYFRMQCRRRRIRRRRRRRLDTFHQLCFSVR